MGQILLMLGLPVALGLAVRAHYQAFALRFEPKATRVATVLFVLIVMAAVIKNWALLRDNFGPGVMTADGRIDRRALAGIVFSDPAELLRLESLTHPAVRVPMLRRGTRRRVWRSTSMRTVSFSR